MRADNKLLDIVIQFEEWTALKRFGIANGLTFNDLNILVAVMKTGKQPTANSPEASCIPYIMQYVCSGREVVLKGLRRLQEFGLILRSDRSGPGRGMVNTYHLTKAGRDVINAYYESEFCRVKRRY